MQQDQMVPLLRLRLYRPVLCAHFQPLIQALQAQNFFFWFPLGAGEFCKLFRTAPRKPALRCCQHFLKSTVFSFLLHPCHSVLLHLL